MRKFLFFTLAVLMVVTVAVNLVFATPPKILVYSKAADPQGLDPAYVNEIESGKIIVNIYETLVKYKPGSTAVEPCLATSWTQSPDGLVWTFKLRKGVKFHDGTPFNAEAVKASVERQLPPFATSDMPYASFTFEPVKQVEAVNPYTVKFILSKPFAPFLLNLAMCFAAPIVSPTALKKYGADFNQHPVGTGPFKFEKWDHDQQILLVRNDQYWGKKALMDKVIYKTTKENTVRASELMTGEADIIDGVDPNDVKKLESSGMKVLKTPGMNINYLAFFCNKKPFSDPRVRQAISMAINRPEVVKYLYQGYAQLANGPLPSFIPGYDPSLKALAYNPEKAKKMLAEAGYPHFQFTMLTYSVARAYNPVNGQKLAEAIQAELLKIGVKTTIKVYPWKEYFDVVNKGEEGDACFKGWIGDNGDPDNFLSLFDSSQIATNLNTARYSNPKVDELLREGTRTLNQKDRIKIYQQMQRILVADAPWVFINHATVLTAYQPKVKDFYPHPTGVSWLSQVSK